MQESDSLAVRDQGQGPILVFVHGTPSSSAEYEGVISLLKSDFRCIAVDHLGFGASPKPKDGDYSIAAHRRRLKSVLARLGVTKYHLVVHDFGGAIALPLALPDSDGLLSLTILNSWLWPLVETEPQLARQRWLMTSPLMRFLYLYANFSAQVLVRASWGTHRRLTPDVHRRYLSAFKTPDERHGTVAFLRELFFTEDSSWQAYRDLARLSQVPTQIIWGARDVISVKTLDRWRSLLPSAAIHVLDDVGHFVADEAPELLAPLIRKLCALDGPLRLPIHPQPTEET